MEDVPIGISATFCFVVTSIIVAIAAVGTTSVRSFPSPRETYDYLLCRLNERLHKTG
jgi:hypothetical protein